MPSQLYIRVRGRVLGPFDEQKLQSLAARGQFGRMHEVSEDGVAWVRASQYADLFRGEAAAAEPAVEVVPVDSYSATVAMAASEVRGASLEQADWLYSRDGGQHGPVTLSQLQSLVAGGTLGPSDLVWTNGMGQWTPISQLPILAPAAAPVIATSHAKGSVADSIVRPLRDCRPWILTFAVLYSISAALSVIGGIILLVVAAKMRNETLAFAAAFEGMGSMFSGILLVITSVLLYSLAGSIREFVLLRTEASLETALLSLKRFIVFWGIVTIVMIVIVFVVCIYLLAIA